ncbi:MAG: histidine kinase [Clostridia bacterium]
MKTLNEHLTQIPIRIKLIAGAAVFTLLFGMVCGTLTNNLNNLYREYERISQVCAQLEAGTEMIDDLNASLDSLIYRGAEALYVDFALDMRKAEHHYASITVNARDYETYYLFQDILNLLETYSTGSAALIYNISMRDYNASSNGYSKLENTAGFICSETEKLVAKLYDDSGVLYDRISRQMQLFNICMPIISIGIIVYLIGIVLYLNRRFIKPIYQLSAMAQHISAGEYLDEKLVFESENDFNILSTTMFDMSATIRSTIADINNRTRMMQELSTQQIENLRIKSMFNQLELRRLQEQITPHFLFNSLSTLQHTAYLEGANKTCEICNAISKLLRYNLRQSETTVTLVNELENLSYYIYIQTIRFSERVVVKIDAPPIVPEVEMPRMILQPIVENCYSHGLANMCRGGRVTIRVDVDEAFVRVCIHDNGKGMDAKEIEKYEELFAQDDIDAFGHEHIGLLNVAKRLQGFYNRRDVIKLYGGIGDFHVEMRLFRSNVQGDAACLTSIRS